MDNDAYTVVAKDEVNGWTYISEYAQIEFHGRPSPAGAYIQVYYEVAGAVQETATEEPRPRARTRGRSR